MQNNIRFFLSLSDENWRLVDTEDIENKYYQNILVLIIKNNDETFSVETRICMTSPSLSGQIEKIDNIEKGLTYKSVKDFIASFFKILNYKNIHIFKFDSNDDFPLFVEWAQSREKRLLKELENL